MFQLQTSCQYYIPVLFTYSIQINTFNNSFKTFSNEFSLHILTEFNLCTISQLLLMSQKMCTITVHARNVQTTAPEGQSHNTSFLSFLALERLGCYAHLPMIIQFSDTWNQRDCVYCSSRKSQKIVSRYQTAHQFSALLINNTMVDCILNI